MYFLGVLGSSVFKVVLVNTTVQIGDYFDVYPNNISQNLLSSSYSIECGYESSAGGLFKITDWNAGAALPTMVVLPNGPAAAEYYSRTTVHNSTIMRINNVRFKDEGRTFYCELTNYNVYPFIFQDKVKLERVYGKEFLEIYNLCIRVYVKSA